LRFSFNLNPFGLNNQFVGNFDFPKKCWAKRSKKHEAKLRVKILQFLFCSAIWKKIVLGLLVCLPRRYCNSNCSAICLNRKIAQEFFESFFSEVRIPKKIRQSRKNIRVRRKFRAQVRSDVNWANDTTKFSRRAEHRTTRLTSANRQSDALEKLERSL